MLALALLFLSPPLDAAGDVITNCLDPCHYGLGEAPDIATTWYGPAENAGHKMNWDSRVIADTSGALLPQGAKMPCNECHVTHGVETSIYNFSTARNGGVPIVTIRTLCEGCHLPYDSSAPAVTVKGLVMKKLPSGPDEHADASVVACSDCHGASGHAPEGHGAGGLGCGDVACHGGTGSHAIHLTADARFSAVLACDACHNTDAYPNFAAGTDSDLSGYIELDETTVCDVCHSPGGDYDGVDSAAAPSGAMSVGAKDNWASRVYQTANSLQAGKAKWCAGCHDDDPALIGGVYAPPVIGNEDGAYIYGTGWGFYKTGHGTPASAKIPSNGFSPGAGLECDNCHDFLQGHIDGNRRTFSASGGTPTTYRTGYRLDLVGGSDPMLIPWPGSTNNSANNYRLCTSGGCHDSYPYLNENPSDRRTNLWTELGTGDPKKYNMHKYHLEFFNQLRWAPDWGASMTSRISCPSCHNVHGSKYLAMIQDGELISDTVERRPGLRIWYWDSVLSAWSESDQNPPTPEDITLAMSDGWVWSGGSSGNLCSHCHGNYNTIDVQRTLWQSLGINPVLSWLGTAGYENDGVNPDSGSALDTFTFRIKYSDANNDAPTIVALRIDRNDDGDYADAGETVSMNPDLPGDLTYYNGNPYNISIQLAKAGDNVLNYYFETSNPGGSASTSTRTLAVTNAAPTLPWTGESGYLDDGVNPNSGTTGVTSYEFRITYRDADGEAPSGGAPSLYLDKNDDGDFADAGETIAMSPMAGGDYVTGKRYTYSTTIARQSDDTISYRFGASDGIDSVQTAIKTVTVLENVNFAPSLAWTGETGYTTDGVDPENQAATKPFFFRVTYTDANNDAPGVKQVWIDLDDDTVYEPGEKFTMDDAVTSGAATLRDGVYTNGELFAEKIYIPYAGDGTLKYCFYFTDALAAEATGVQLTDRNLSVYNAVDVPSEYGTIQLAVNAATTGQTVLVADGTWAGFGYNGKDITVESVNGPASTTISGGSNVVDFNNTGDGSNSTLRGFTVRAGTTGIASNGSDAVVENCIIEANNVGVYHQSGSTKLLTIDDSIVRNNTSHGIQTTNVGARLNLTDTTVSGNGGDGILQGGGVTVIERCVVSGNTGAGYNNGNAGANATLRDTTVTGNSNRGIYAAGGTWVMERCTLSSNTVTGSGGAWYSASVLNLTMSDCVVSANTASGDSGGFHFTGNSSYVVNIDRTYIRGNRANGGQGGGFFAGQGAYNIRNCAITGNYASTNGGGVAINNGGVIFTNCTFGGNSGFTGGAVFCNILSNGQSKVRNCVLWGNDSRNTVYEEIDGSSDTARNRMEVQYTDINQTFTSFFNQTGNMTANPLFVDPRAASSAPTVAGDYHLQNTSPCEGAASASFAPAVDIDNGARPVGSGYDMGSDEIASGAPAMMAAPVSFTLPVKVPIGGGDPGPITGPPAPQPSMTASPVFAEQAPGFLLIGARTAGSSGTAAIERSSSGLGARKPGSDQVPIAPSLPASLGAVSLLALAWKALLRVLGLAAG